MFDQNDDSVSNKPKKQGGRIRVREVDFMRAEDTVQGQELTAFELEVKSEMASAQSPFEELMSREEQKNESQKKRISKYRLSCVVRKAKLSVRQAECYRLIWIKKLSENKAAQILGISRSRVRDIKQSIRFNLMAALEKEKKRNQQAVRARFACKTDKQRKIWKLYFKEGKTISEISRDLTLSRQAVQQLLKRILPTV